MTIKSKKGRSKKVQKYLLVFSSLILFSAVPYFAGSGLDKTEPLGEFLNGKFPSLYAKGQSYIPVFPNLKFNSPLTFNEVPNKNKIIIGQRDGQLFWFDKTQDVSVKNVLLDLTEKVGIVGDGGFLGLTLHPKFGTSGNNYFYTWYATEDANSEDRTIFTTTQSCDNEEHNGNFLVLARYSLDPNTMASNESSEQILLKIRMHGSTHRGGGLLFGDDGFLYLTTGDQTAWKKAQDIINNLDGGVLRIDVDKDPTKSHAPIKTMPDDHGFSDEITGNGYWIPNDNPFLSPNGSNFEEYYSLGHRSPHRMTKDRATGDLYVGEVGGGRHEEINIIKKGKNYGWPLYEGLYQHTNCVQNLYNNMSHEPPLVAFPRTDANTIIGGYVYRGSEIPELKGKYICADYGEGEEIWTIDTNSGDYTQLGDFTATNIISFGEDQQGELYIMKIGTSSLYKLVSKSNPPAELPNRLSETGAFKNLRTLEPTDGLIPYDLVQSFWSDGTEKKRWIGIPNDGKHDSAGERIIYSKNDVWNFPIGSVLIKHFEMPIDENNPSITKRLETRFSLKGADGNFYFTTYKWNEQGTDATILTSGLDETINIIKTDGSIRKQTYTYPSNIDCVSCHNSATGGTLGTRSRNLNKDYTYPKTGKTANQLVTLSHLGILNQEITEANTASILTSKAIDDPTASLDEKARSYLDLNCASCHRPGTGNRTTFDLRLKLNLEQTGLLTAAPYESLGIPNEKIVDPGSPETSILYHRLNSADLAVRMPTIAKNEIDSKAVKLINDWIGELTSNDNPCKNRIIMERYDNISSATISALKNDPNFPDNPSKVDEVAEFSSPTDFGDNYAIRIKGLLKAPETGMYYFWISGDRHAELSMSSDTNPDIVSRIAYQDNNNGLRQWNRYPTQKSVGIKLEAGKNYYIEALMNESTGRDHLAVGWRKPSDGDGEAPIQIIPCSAFDYFNGAPVVKVASVSVTPATASLNPGKSTNLAAKVLPANATNPAVTWSSSNTRLATVNASGKVTAVAVGTVTITATTKDGGFKDTAKISVVDPNGEDCTATGSITMHRYDNIPGITLSELFNAPKFPDTPAKTIKLNSFEISGSDDANNYGAWVTGYLCAPETGTYYFWVSGDDYVRLNLSTNDKTANKTTIAYHNGHTNYRMWDRYDSQKSIAIKLVKGKTYYIEGFVKENNGGDHLSVGWRKPSDGAGAKPSEIIPGKVLSPNLDTSNDLSVSGVSIDRTYVSLVEGNSVSLNEQVSPANAANLGVTWKSSNTNVATVNSNGKVSSIAAGNATITVRTNDGGYTAQSNIVVHKENDTNCSASGSISMRRYDNINGITLDDLYVAASFPNDPSSSIEISSFEIPEHVADNYGAWVSGYLCAPETGTYYFWVAGDNYVQLNLSTDDTVEKATKIAYHEGHTNTRIWNKYKTQKSIGIKLKKGESYYIEAYLKELNGGDHLAVAWSKPSDTNNNAPSEIIPGSVLSPYTFRSFTFQASLKEGIDVSKINIYPNPTSELVHIETLTNKKITQLYVYDAIGKVVMEVPQSEFEENQQNYVINVAHLAKGVYTIIITTENWQQHTEKIIVK